MSTPGVPNHKPFLPTRNTFHDRMEAAQVERVSGWDWKQEHKGVTLAMKLGRARKWTEKWKAFVE